ncbi:MAG: hypothetical protein ABR548_07150 [Actinomycetota bacterium]|nr:hypothetical protein [Actinomycetota bacterium]
MSKYSKLLAVLIAGLLVTGSAVVVVRGTKTTGVPKAIETTESPQPAAGTPFESPTEAPATPTEAPSQGPATQTPSATPTEIASESIEISPSSTGLAHTGLGDSSLPAAALTLFIAMACGAALLRSS